MVCLSRIVLWCAAVLSVSSSLAFFIDTDNLTLCQLIFKCSKSRYSICNLYICSFLYMVVEKACIEVSGRMK